MWRAAGLLAVLSQNTQVFSQNSILQKINLPIKLDNTNTTEVDTFLKDIAELKIDANNFYYINIAECSSPECKENEKTKIGRFDNENTPEFDGVKITVSTVGQKTFFVQIPRKGKAKDTTYNLNMDVYTGLSEANLNFPDDLFSARKNTIDASSDKSFCEITKVHPDVEIEISQDGTSPADISQNLIVENKTVLDADDFGLVTVRRQYRFQNTSLLANPEKYGLKCVVKNYVPEGVSGLTDSEKTLEATKNLNITGPPEIISFGTISGENLVHGEEGTIRCEVTAMPQAKVTIHRKNGNKWINIDSISREQSGNKMTVDYKISKVDIADHFGGYKCQADNEFQDESVINETSVFVTREITGEYKTETSDATVGQSMSCEVQAYPKPFALYWRKKGTTTKIDAKAKFTFDKNTATANINYKSKLVGGYECVMKAKQESDVVVLYSVQVEDKAIMSEILSNPTYYIIVGSIILLLIISVLVIVMMKRRSSGPPQNSESAHPDVASTTVAASSDHDMEKGNVNEDKGGTGEQAALMKNEV